MALVKLQFQPGINRDVTYYAGEGAWYDCDKIRFHGRFPESIGGWEAFTTGYLGQARSLHAWSSLDNQINLGIGTHLKFYVWQGNSTNDITPLRGTTAAGDVTFAATDGSTTITVSDTSHGAALGDYVTFSGAASLGGTVTADVLNSEFQITAITDANTYTVEVAAAANASDTGNGGANVVGAYQINVGLNTVAGGVGWGSDPWSDGGWGSAGNTVITSSQIRLWSQDAYGEDLFFCVRDGGLYYFDYSGGFGSRAVALSDLTGANKAPTLARQVLVSDRDRHAIAVGCDGEFSTGTRDPMLIRFSAQEDITDWESRQDNTAGSLRLSAGSEILSAVQTKQQTLVFTDTSVYAMQFVGPPYTFGVTKISDSTTIIGYNAAVAVNDVVYWMGLGRFYIFDGRVRELPSSVVDYVFEDLNLEQRLRVCAGHNSDFGEVWWFYPSASSTENDRYVVYNYTDNLWYFGTMARTAWLDHGIFDSPLAAGTDGSIYSHELGVNDGSQNPPVAINSYIESYAMDMGEGDQFLFANRVIPDISFRRSSGTPAATFTVKAWNEPGGGSIDSYDKTTMRTASAPLELYTKQLHVRIRGRAMAIRVEADEYNTAWQLGYPRIDVRTDGRR